MTQDMSVPSVDSNPIVPGAAQETASSELPGLAKQLGSLLRRSVSRIQQDVPVATEVQPSVAETTPSSSMDDKYPDVIWAYLEGSYHLDLRYLPTRDDRDRLDGMRQQIWDYFFRPDPRDVGKPQQREIANLKDSKSSEERSYELRRRELEERRATLDRERDLLQQILHVQEAVLKVQQMPPDVKRGTKSLPGLLGRVTSAVEALDQSQQQEQSALEDQLRRLEDELAVIQQRSDNRSNVDNPAASPRPLKTVETVEQEVAAIAQELADLQQKHSSRVQGLDERIGSLTRSIEFLKLQIPTPPPDDQVRQWLQEDLEALEQRSQFRVAAGTRLQSIGSYDESGSTERVTDMISLVSPGRLQDATRLPPTYIPPQIGAARNLADKAIAEINVSGFQLAQWIRPKTVPDRGKHFLAKRLLRANGSIEVLYGVYYVDHLMILDDMIVLHSFFFDFVSGTTAADRITEVYYRDIVALEITHEYRAIPLQYTDDPNAVLILEDVPVLGLALSNGDRHTISFVNEAYLRGMLKYIESELSSLRGLDPQASERYIRQKLHETLQVADDAIKVLRAQVRRHKAF